MTEELIFTDARVRRWTHGSSLPGKLERLLAESPLSSIVPKNEPVALKMHFGSWGAHKIIRPALVRRVVDAVREAGGKPFVTDTVRIKGIDYLDVAASNGLTPQSVGCPVILADGLFGMDYVKVECGGDMPFAPVASVIHDVPAMILLTHCKGHVQAGYAGAVKNLAMGCVSALNREASDVRKKVGRPGMHLCHRGDVVHHAETCDLCGQCLDACPLDALSEKDGKIILDRKKCWSCCRCARVCPTGAMEAPDVGPAFQDALAQVAASVLKTFDPGRLYCLNFMLDIQPECDCMPGADVNALQDAGILGGRSPCTVDWATCDVLKKTPPLPDSLLSERGCTEPGSEPWEAVHGKSGREHIRILADLTGADLEYAMRDIDEKS
jgi:uncharacterized Fe-S center protein